MEETSSKENSLFANQRSLNEGASRSSSSEFTIGQLVALRSNPTHVGAIIYIFPRSPENRYIGFVDNAPSTYYAIQLRQHYLPPPSFVITPLPVFHAYRTAVQLNHPSLVTLYS